MNTVQVGRTHGQHAEPTSLGYRFAITYQELENALTKLYLSRREIEIVTIKGSTGTYAHISPQIQEDLSYRLRLFTSPGSFQAFPRNRYSFYFSVLSHIGQIINSLVTTLRSLSREEIGEFSEVSEDHQIGSSSMPHKKNPITLENISGLSR
ncbi:hypothetical protein PVNG_02414 [Plasmodium vivax North Korean]|uniref:Fumarate lyase N-terminal domain-containing protein n=1 Tax=Plasmodium vivax North Korean TaxID=1035514 RepID=A0A0J9TM82_PLAVI|nr:hypothetical protein PVNG_02414 [Plasmodium vivax North Korean]